jgi:hypothetical protein
VPWNGVAGADRHRDVRRWPACSGWRGRQADDGIVAHWRGGFQRHASGALGGSPVILFEEQRAGEADDGLTHMQPGKPRQNAYVERYNRTLRHEWLEPCILETTAEVQQVATEWLWTYNNERPNWASADSPRAMKLTMAA